jgi:hypothetical protein
LVDRRHASHPESRYGSTAAVTSFSFWSEDVAQGKVTLDLEVIISRHFIEKYYNFLLLPNCHAIFQDGWICEIQERMISDESLRYSVLANAASHIYNMDTNPGMQSLALEYYSKSIRGLSDKLTQADDPHLARCNGFLMSIMLLYLHGVSAPSHPYVTLLIDHLSVWATALILTFHRTFTQQCAS